MYFTCFLNMLLFLSYISLLNKCVEIQHLSNWCFCFNSRWEIKIPYLYLFNPLTWNWMPWLKLIFAFEWAKYIDVNIEILYKNTYRFPRVITWKGNKQYRQVANIPGDIFQFFNHIIIRDDENPFSQYPDFRSTFCDDTQSVNLYANHDDN